MGVCIMRPNGWEDRLIQYVEDKRNMKFKWGDNDCVTFALNGVKCVFLTDDLMEELPEWKNKKQAQEAIDSFGGDLSHAASCYLPDVGFMPKPITKASRGDLVVFSNENNETLFSLCIGTKLAAPGKEGIVFLPIRGECWEYVGRRAD